MALTAAVSSRRLTRSRECDRARRAADLTTLAVDAIVKAANNTLRGGGEAALLSSCYRCSLKVAAQHRLSTIAFPAISTGVSGYPKDATAAIAVATVRATLPACPSSREVIFCCHTLKDLTRYPSAW